MQNLNPQNTPIQNTPIQSLYILLIIKVRWMKLVNYILDKKQNINKKPMIYFLIKDNKIIYVGQSKFGVSRIYGHRDKDFDSFSYIEVDVNELDEREAFYIVELSPILNSSYLPSNKTYIHANNIKHYFSMGAWDVKRLLKRNNAKSYYNGEYYKISEIEILFTKMG